MTSALSIFYFLVLIFSIIAHEVAHGIAAEREGDPTARMLGRITLNPLPHLDLIGSVVLPLALILTNAGFVVGWAKPVPYNPDNLRRGNKSVALVAGAGILVNLGIAVFFGLAIRFLVATGHAAPSLIDIASIVVLVNIILALFNAIPLYPLDGFTILASALPASATRTIEFIRLYSLPLLILFVLFGWHFVAPLAYVAFSALSGIPLTGW